MMCEVCNVRHDHSETRYDGMTSAKPLHNMVCEVCNIRHDHSVTKHDGMTSAKLLHSIVCEVCNDRHCHSVTRYDGMMVQWCLCERSEHCQQLPCYGHNAQQPPCSVGHRNSRDPGKDGKGIDV